MIRSIHGKAHGRTIELSEDLGLQEGQDVEVTVRSVPPQSMRKPGDGFLSTEGALQDDEEWDKIMDDLHRARKDDRRIPWEEP